jgi:predicted transcriptional regulator
MDGPFLGARGPFPTPNPSVGVVVTAPALTDATDGDPTDDGTEDATVDSTVGNGTLYWAVLSDDGAATAAQIKAGSGGDIVVAGAQGVSGTGTQTVAEITGLESGTDYEIVFLQTSAGGADSAQATVALTTT